KMSLNPEKPGGWVYALLGLWYVWRRDFDVVHIHGWRAAAVVYVWRVFTGEANLIRTIDSMPTVKFPRWFMRRLCGRFDSVITPTRELQYRLLHEYGVYADYLPDGYNKPVLDSLPLRRWGLRDGQYSVVLAGSTAVLKEAAQAYEKTKTRKKLVVLREETGNYKRLGRQYKFLKFLGEQSSRPLRSVIEGAAVVIAADESVQVGTLLQAMNTKKAIIAVNAPLYQETLGVTAQYFKAGDSDGLGEAITAVVSDKKAQAVWGRAAQKRAQNHFLWRRILPEYLTAYCHAVRLVPMDSAVLVVSST
ncbi:MAG: glycosyltransferase, partial [Candidatus Andersenbacteria bacterium]|nr:glycosyltransferase [Candidatus Andersenbacteria bacterium]